MVSIPPPKPGSTAQVLTQTARPVKPDDAYEWLEPQEAPEALEWAAKETSIAKAKLASLPQTKDIEQQLRKLAATDVRIPDFSVCGKLFRLLKSDTNKEGLVQMTDTSFDGTPAAWETILDMDELNRIEGKSYQFVFYALGAGALGPDASRILVTLSDGGSDVSELRELDVKERRFVPDGFRAPEGRLQVAWLDLDHILISHALDGGPVTQANWPTTTYIWKRGTDLKEANPVFTMSPSDTISVLGSMGPTNSGRAVITHAIDYQTIRYIVVSVDGTTYEVDLPMKQPMPGIAKTTATHVFASLSEETLFCGRKLPIGSVVAYDTSPEVPESRRQSVVWIPEPDEFSPFLAFGGMVTTQSRLHLTVSRRGLERRLVFELDGEAWKVIRTVPTATGSTANLAYGDGYSNQLIVSESGMLSPCVVRLERDDGTQAVLFAQESAFKLGDFTVEVKSTQSRDGTVTIDYTVLRPKVFEGESGQQPVLMTGYGAFGISMPMGYLSPFLGGISLVPWLESGGALVVPAIRGGGERGPAWHEAARQEKRQKSYDDFISVAERLIADGMTTAGRIGVYGTSNGGLLSAVMGMQRPDLFGAIVSDVPLTDMLRFPRMGMGAAWEGEYGNPEDPDAAAVLRSYSPFHNIPEGSKLPPFLVTISTRDDRVGAGHARKLVARLKDSGAEAYLIEETVGGHGVSDPFKRAAFMAGRISFWLECLVK
jgi:prolyl oligopeptidase